MKRVLAFLILFTVGCSTTVQGRPVNLTLTKQLILGESTAKDVLALLGKPFRARPIANRALFACDAADVEPAEQWTYTYVDWKHNHCTAHLTFDAGAVLCKIEQDNPAGPLCSGVLK